MKKSMILALVAILSVLLVACGKEPVVAQEPPVVATPTTESPDEGKPTEVPPEPVVTEEPTPEPEPTLEPTPEPEEPEEEILPEPSAIMWDYIDEDGFFDINSFAFDFGCDKKHPCSADSKEFKIMSFSMNGWAVFLWAPYPAGADDGYISVAKKIEGDNYNKKAESTWDIPFIIEDEDDATLLKWREASSIYPTEAIDALPYVLQWCKENPYQDEAPDVFKDKWEVW